MFRLQSKYRLFDLFEIPIYIDFSFIVLLVLFVNDFGSFSYGLTGALVLAVSVMAHEFGHALTARAFGYQTRDITLSLIGGCASLIALPRKGWQEFLTAVAGPLVSFVLAAVGFALLVVSPPPTYWSRFAVMYLFYINVALGVFNLLPGFPMDGGRVLRSVLLSFTNRPRATLIAMWVGRVVAILLGLSGLHAIVTDGGWGLIRIFIAVMIWREGYREYMCACAENAWTYRDFRAKVSPPPYERD